MYIKIGVIGKCEKTGLEAQQQSPQEKKGRKQEESIFKNIFTLGYRLFWVHKKCHSGCLPQGIIAIGAMGSLPIHGEHSI
jgi:hypothetical protein